MTGRLRIAGLLLAALLMTACQSEPLSKEAALTALVRRAAEGRAPEDAYAELVPGGEAFSYLEEWLDVNAEAVQGVVAAGLPDEGAFCFTRSADGRRTYLITRGWPGPQVRSKVLRPAPGSRITLLGWEDALPWEQLGGTLVITTPREMADEENHPCVQYFVFRAEAPAR
jgi:hypothetical protein